MDSSNEGELTLSRRANVVWDTVSGLATLAAASQRTAAAPTAAAAATVADSSWLDLTEC